MTTKNILLLLAFLLGAVVTVPTLQANEPGAAGGGTAPVAAATREADAEDDDETTGDTPSKPSTQTAKPTQEEIINQYKMGTKELMKVFGQQLIDLKYAKDMKEAKKMLRKKKDK